MTIRFTEQEEEWIDKKPFDWKIKEGCPKRIADSLQKKLDILNKKTYDYEGGVNGKISR